MSGERILEIIENADKYYILSFIEEIKAILEGLQQENQQLKSKLKTYEDPEDLTLMYMYIDEKAKDKIKKFQQENQQLKIQISAREEEYKKLENNWNELRSWLEENINQDGNGCGEWWVAFPSYMSKEEIINKINELKGKSE